MNVTHNRHEVSHEIPPYENIRIVRGPSHTHDMNSQMRWNEGKIGDLETIGPKPPFDALSPHKKLCMSEPAKKTTGFFRWCGPFIHEMTSFFAILSEDFFGVECSYFECKSSKVDSVWFVCRSLILLIWFFVIARMWKSVVFFRICFVIFFFFENPVFSS